MLASVLLATSTCVDPPVVPEGRPDPQPSQPFVSRTPPHSTDPSMTPDGRWLVFATKNFGPTYDIYRKTPDGETVTLVVASEGDDRFPAVAPDGKRMAFCSTVEGYVAVYLIPDYRNPPPVEQWPLHRISPPNVHSIHPSWAPDGKALVYCSNRGNNWSESLLMIYETEAEDTHILGLRGLLPEWSPTDDRIVFQKMRGRDDFLGGLWIAQLKGYEVTAETRIFDMPDVAAINPSWSPDGTRIIFAITRSLDPETSAVQEARDLGVIPVDGTEFWRITEDEEADYLPIWVSGGTVYFVSERDGPPAIWTMTPDILRSP